MSQLSASLGELDGKTRVLVKQDSGFGEHCNSVMRAVHQSIKWVGGKDRLWAFPFLPASVYALEEASDLLGLDLKLSPELIKVRDQVRSETAQEEQTRKVLQAYFDDTKLPLAPYTTQQNPPPWRHQALAYHWAVRTRVLYLMHKMGLGKTREGADIIRGKWELGHIRPMEQFLSGAGPSSVDPTKMLPEQWCTKGGALITCPAAVLGEWVEQLWRWQGIQAIPITGSGAAAKRERAGMAGYVHVCSYESLEMVERNCYDFVVADEGHFIANHEANRFKRMMAIRRKAKHALMLSGTAQSNGLESLWAQFFWLDGGRTLGPTLAKFRKTFLAKKDRTDGLTPEQAVSRAISRIAWPLSMQEAFPDKPIKINKVIHVEMTEEQADYYEKIRLQAEADILTGKVNLMESMTRLTKLLQVTQGFVLDSKGVVQKFSSAKLNVLQDLIKKGGDLDGRRTIVWSRFNAEVTMITEMLRREKIPHLILQGGMSQKQKDVMKAIWNRDPAQPDLWQGHPVYPILVGKISMGIGLNLHAPQCVDDEGKPAKCSSTVFYGIDWKMTQVEQAMDRVYRGDQTETCLYTYLLSKDMHSSKERKAVVPIDVRVYESLMAKMGSAKEVNEESIRYVRSLLAS